MFFVSKETAYNILTSLEKFYDFPWENPLQNSYDIHLKAEYVEKDSIPKLKNNYEQTL
jgi:cell division transport system permease protein